MKIAGVRFRDNWRVYDFDATDVELAVGDSVIVESDRGLGFARVMRFREADELPFAPPPAQEQPAVQNGKPKEADEDEEIEIDVETPGDVAAAAAAAVTATASPAPATERPKTSSKGHRKVIRKATADDIAKEEKNQEREAEAFKSCQEMIAEREIPMKLIRADYSFDGSRVTLYFFSENRVDFRELVKDLAHKLRSRIEMRQVGVRDVARIIGGFGPCGRELCCTSYLRGFEPVSIRMAKKQDMVLNPAKISGVCGRLLCCLSYEFGMYDAIKKDIAEMKEAVVREKREEEDRRLSDQRQEAEERRLIEEKNRREDDRQRQERQREKQKQPPQQREVRRPEQKKEGGQDQKQRPPQEQQREKQRQQPQQQKQQRKQQQQKQPQQQQQKQQQKPGPEETGQEPQVVQEGQALPQGEKSGGSRKRRFWRNKKKRKGGGEGPQTPAGGPPSQG
ncbi:MAG: regulatory iron-sulfur-containing complex subunit RicT [Nitrospirota bacterium]